MIGLSFEKGSRELSTGASGRLMQGFGNGISFPTFARPRSFGLLVLLGTRRTEEIWRRKHSNNSRRFNHKIAGKRCTAIRRLCQPRTEVFPKPLHIAKTALHCFQWHGSIYNVTYATSQCKNITAIVLRGVCRYV